MTKEENQKKNGIEMIEIPVQTGFAYQLPDGTVIKTTEEAILWMMNVLWEIKKSVA